MLMVSGNIKVNNATIRFREAQWFWTLDQLGQWLRPSGCTTLVKLLGQLLHDLATVSYLLNGDIKIFSSETCY